MTLRPQEVIDDPGWLFAPILTLNNFQRCAIIASHGPRVANVAPEARALAGRGAFAVDDLAGAADRVRALLEGRLPAPDPRPALATLRGAADRQVDLMRPILEAVADR